MSLTIKGILNFSLECEKCGVDEVNRGVEIEVASLQEIQDEFDTAFNGWHRSSTVVGGNEETLYLCADCGSTPEA